MKIYEYRLPKTAERPITREFSIGNLHFHFETNSMEKNRLFQYKIPTFQRELCWTISQEIAFIESIWLDYPIGNYMVNSIDDIDSDLHNLLIDGQQRLNTLQRYFNNEFSVFGFYWNELNRLEISRFLNRKFVCLQINETDLPKLKDAYNRLNFSGTPHNENKKA